MVKTAAADKFDHPPPSANDLARIGEETLAQLPSPFQGYASNVVIRVQDFPDEETLSAMSAETPFDLLGLYHGVPIGHDGGFEQPRHDVDMIFLYRRPLLDYWCETGFSLTDIVKNTLIHEIGHHFGLTDDDMDQIEFGTKGEPAL